MSEEDEKNTLLEQNGHIVSTSRRVLQAFPKSIINGCCACCNCCGALLLFCITAIFWAYHDQDGTGTITQKSLFLGFSITYVIVAIFIGAIVALMLYIFHHEIFDKIILSVLKNIEMTIKATMKRFDGKQVQKLNKEIDNIGEGGQDIIKQELDAAQDEIVSTFKYHLIVLGVLIICCIVSFSLCWAFVTHWDQKNKEPSLFAAGVVVTLITIGLCILAMGLAIRDTIKDVNELMAAVQGRQHLPDSLRFGLRYPVNPVKEKWNM